MTKLVISNDQAMKVLLKGLALGDALGLPHEFHSNDTYTGKLELSTRVRTGSRYNPVYKNTVEKVI